MAIFESLDSDFRTRFFSDGPSSAVLYAGTLLSGSDVRISPEPTQPRPRGITLSLSVNTSLNQNLLPGTISHYL